MKHSLCSIIVVAAAVALMTSCDNSSNSSDDDKASPQDTSDTSVTPAGTVVAPTFSPAGGTYTSSQSVAITSATSGATIYYTTDGNIPTTSSSQYTSAMTVSTSKTLKAIAVKTGMATSSVSSATYTISGGPSDSTIPGNTSITYGSLTYSGQTYKTVVIGTQTWMAENLNVNVDSSWCYENSADSCAKYGRLYSWASAMKLPDSCIFALCASQIQSKHQGVCPSGWYVPSDAEWKILSTYVGGESKAGTKLKSTSGWSYKGKSGNGMDSYGFRALPAGTRGYNGDFDGVGYDAYLWSSSEFDAFYAWGSDLISIYPALGRANRLKNVGFSVRCLKDGP